MLIFGYRLQLWQCMRPVGSEVAPLPGLHLLLGYCNITQYMEVCMSIHVQIENTLVQHKMAKNSRTHIEIPTMLQPQNMVVSGKYWLVVPSKQQPGDNRVFETVTGLFLGCFDHGLGCNNHTPTSQHRVMHIYYYLLLFSSAFSFYSEKISIYQQQ